MTPYPFSPEKKSDVRDVWIHYRPDAKAAWEYLSGLLIEIDLDTPEEEIPAAICTSFEDLDLCYRQHLHWTDVASDALAVTMAVAISSRIKGPLLWTYLIAPSGGGKSTICEATSADRLHVKRVNSFTGLHSGYKTGDTERPDVSLISKLQGKILVIPDFTSILALSPQMQEKIYGELRNIYDGVSSMHYGNDLDREYTKITFPIVAGVTHEIHGLRKSALGERFLKVDMTDTHQSDNIVMRTIMNVANSAASSLADNEVSELNPFMREIKSHTLGFMQHLFKKVAGGVKVSLPPWFAKKLAALAAIVAAARGEPKRQTGSDRDLVYRPVLEVGSHVGGQLTKLSMALAVVLDRDPDNEILRRVTKVAMDTAYGFQLDIIRALGNAPQGMTVDQLAIKIRLSPSTVRKICDDLRELGVVYKKHEESASGIGGREAHVCYLSPRIRKCWEEIHGPPSETPKRQLWK
jgi:DNA-binding MarR family transcriptional regulator